MMVNPWSWSVIYDAAKDFAKSLWNNTSGAGAAKSISSAGGSAFIGKNSATYFENGVKALNKDMKPGLSTTLQWAFTLTFAAGTGIATFGNRYHYILRRDKQKEAAKLKAKQKAANDKKNQKPESQAANQHPKAEQKVIGSEDKKDQKPEDHAANQHPKAEQKVIASKDKNDQKPDNKVASQHPSSAPLPIGLVKVTVPDDKKISEFDNFSPALKFGYYYLQVSTGIYMVLGGFNSWLQLGSLLNYAEECEGDISTIQIVKFIAFNLSSAYLMYSQMKSQIYYGIPLQNEYFKKFFVDRTPVSVTNVFKSFLITSLSTLSVWYSNPSFIDTLSRNTWMCRAVPSSFEMPSFPRYVLSGTGCLFNFTIGFLQSLASFHNVGSGHTKESINKYLDQLNYMKPYVRVLFVSYLLDAFANFSSTILAVTDLPKRDDLLYKLWLVIPGAVLGILNGFNVYAVDQEGLRKELQGRLQYEISQKIEMMTKEKKIPAEMIDVYEAIAPVLNDALINVISITLEETEVSQREDLVNELWLTMPDILPQVFNGLEVPDAYDKEIMRVELEKRLKQALVRFVIDLDDMPAALSGYQPLLKNDVADHKTAMPSSAPAQQQPDATVSNGAALAPQPAQAADEKVAIPSRAPAQQPDATVSSGAALAPQSAQAADEKVAPPTGTPPNHSELSGALLSDQHSLGAWDEKSVNGRPHSGTVVSGTSLQPYQSVARDSADRVVVDSFGGNGGLQHTLLGGSSSRKPATAAPASTKNNGMSFESLSCGIM